MRDTRRIWVRHPFAAGLVRATIVLVPVALGVTAGLLVSRALPAPEGVGGWTAVLAVVLATTTGVVLLAERLTRRLAPLALLLRLGMVFPDAAPPRFRMAMRAVRPRRLADQLEAHGDEAAPELALSLLASLLAHDRQTRGHSERVAAFTAMLAEEMGLSEEEAIRAEWGGLLHDVGKLDVPTSLLRKPGGLDDDEWQAMREHPEHGRRLVAPLEAWLGEGLRAVEGHHERWDGQGYPGRLAGADIPMAARIVAVTDAFETMTAARCYKDPVARQEARAELAACAGGQFDPVVVRSFLSLSVPRLWLVAGPLAFLVQVPLLGPALRGGLTLPNVPTAASSVVGAAGQVAAAAVITGSAAVLATSAAPEASADADRELAVVESEASGDPGAGEVLARGVAPSSAQEEPEPTQQELEAAGVFAAAVAAAEAEEAAAVASRPPAAGAPEDPVAPGASESAPGQEPGSNPGHGSTPPGQGGTPPGQVPGGNPGIGGTPPGQVPGANPPSQVPGGNPGNGGTPPGQG
jgi:hypothetical protein